MSDCLHTPFFTAASRHPDRLAVVDAERRLSYAQLAHRARLAAAHLNAAGVGRGDRVAVLLDRSAVTIAVWLAVLSLGAVAVPFDMRWPMARRRRLLEGLDLRAVVLDQPATPEVSAIPLRFTPAWLASPIAARSPSPAEPGTPEAAQAADNLACIFFTAGTHSPPKGVCVTHRATRDIVDWLVRETALNIHDRVAGLTAFTSEQSLFDIFATLSAGAALILLSPLSMAQPRLLADMLEREGITALYTVPTVLSLLAQRGDLARHRLASLRLLISSGEPFAGAAFAALQRAVPASVLHLHGYSTAETSLCTLSRFTGADDAPARLPLGHARPGIELLGLPLDTPSAHPPGAVELCVAGPAVMAGYWGDVRDLAPHWWNEPDRGRRLFRTGDAVRQDDQGQWHHLGRVDRPSMPDGRWVDAAEVEQALLGQPGVAHCAVAAAEPGAAYDAPLVAHVVPQPGQDLGHLKQQLAARCLETLPDHLRPQVYVMRGDLPLKASGRVDRHALALDLLKSEGFRTADEVDPSGR